jgi:Mn-dependent DtxR family transcriptional regulator
MSINTDTMVLGAMLRLARRRREASESELGLRVGADPNDIRVSIRRLRAAGLVVSEAGHSRLTLEGLAVAVALAPGMRQGVRVPAVRASRAA